MAREKERIVYALADLCKKHQVGFLIQIGAEDGYEADCIGNITGCRVLAVEGDSQCSPCNPDLEYHHSLIGATNCVMPFYCHKEPGLSSQINRKSVGGHKDKETLVHLQQHRLDTFCSMNDLMPDALIIDTEGTTLDVLEGCGDLLENVKLIYAECQSYPIRPGIRPVSEVKKFLEIRGFQEHKELPSYCNGPDDSQRNYTWIRG